MSQQTFESKNQLFWQDFEKLLSALEQGKATGKMQLTEFPRLYRQLCHQLAFAQNRQYSPYLIDRLNHLVLRGHQQLYQQKAGYNPQILFYITTGFPRLIRQEAIYLWMACFMFYGSLLIMGAVVYQWPEMIYSLLTSDQVLTMESMYQPDKDVIGRDRESDSDFYMFGHYIKNNIGIGFQTFAGGILGGLGTLFYLLYNGLFLGAVAGHLTRIGYDQTFYSFIIGHGAFELTAIVLMGMAGLKLGYALIAPKQKTYIQSLKEAGSIVIQIVYGASLFFLIAAFIEAFWSSSTLLPNMVKYIVGSGFWLLVIAYLGLAGR